MHRIIYIVRANNDYDSNNLFRRISFRTNLLHRFVMERKEKPSEIIPGFGTGITAVQSCRYFWARNVRHGSENFDDYFVKLGKLCIPDGRKGSRYDIDVEPIGG